MNPEILEVNTTFPESYYPQERILDEVEEIYGDRSFHMDRLRQFFKNVQVEGRHLVMPLDHYQQLDGWENRSQRWLKFARTLSEQSVRTVLHTADVRPQEIAVLASTTATGVTVPPLDARLMNQIAFSAGVKRLPFFGYGCLGGVAGIARLADYLRGHPSQLGLLVAVEFCSLTFQPDDTSVANLVGTSLFGDGVASVLLSGNKCQTGETGLPTILDSHSVFYNDHEDTMGWRISDSGFQILLSADVPDLARETLKPKLETFLDRHGLEISDISHWLTHPGGPKVIRGLQEGLGLPDEALALSWDSLRQIGNVSSVSVLHVLEKVLNRREPSDTYGVMLALGPGFSAEMALLCW